MQHLIERAPDEDRLREPVDASAIDWRISFDDIIVVDGCAPLLNWGNNAWRRLILT